MGTKPQKRKVAVLGAGKLGSILIQALIKADLLSRDNIRATVRHADRAEALKKKLHIPVSTSNVDAVKGAQYGCPRCNVHEKRNEAFIHDGLQCRMQMLRVH